ncbi:retroelement pol polyprotein [Acanthamoeba castellanii str. Neff]|uniref:Retroelement pol polyprotein n=1 Tax=Acanthamoeba castellanii (strain ATCC 30010 / Neff) TaxID=1257118 RepID=L8HAB4_ACACF|nr:retroelement pol polyprotein [Acanthamoeba castellanii str. Neff]ELR22172.1 retroelement pol polyprotein [Acanthamoeba castellanii str. Neff]
MKDLSAATSILSMKINYNHVDGLMQLHQHGHINKLLQTFNMSNCNPATTPMEVGLTLNNSETLSDKIPYCQIIGKLLYIAIVLRPDIAYTVSYLSCFMVSFNNTHWTTAKHILHYLKGT